MCPTEFVDKCSRDQNKIANLFGQKEWNRGYMQICTVFCFVLKFHRQAITIEQILNELFYVTFFKHLNYSSIWQKVRTKKILAREKSALLFRRTWRTSWIFVLKAMAVQDQLVILLTRLNKLTKVSHLCYWVQWEERSWYYNRNLIAYRRNGTFRNCWKNGQWHFLLYIYFIS